jgi:kynurenine formamidase
MIGFDFISLSSYAHRDLGREAHRAFLAELEIDGDNKDPILIIEDMDLSKIKICLSKIIVSPLRFEMADGAPVTVFGFYG